MRQFFDVKPVLFVLVLALLVPCLRGTAWAEEWSTYDLPGFTFSVPVDWEVTYSRRDTEYDFVSPDGIFLLWMRLWYPDEPLTGWEDIVFQQNTVLAGKSALLIRHESAKERTLQIAFPEFPNEDGEIILIQLIAPIGLDIFRHEQMISDLAQGLVIDGQPAALPNDAPFGGNLNAPQATANTTPQEDVSKSYHRDAAANISLPRPAGWEVHTATGNDVTQLAVVPPEGDALALVIFGPRASTDKVLGYLYRDSIVVKSIEAETYPTIAGLPAHAIETISKIYTINGIALPYTRGRVWIYQGGTPDAHFILVTIRPEDATKALTGTLENVATGLILGAPPAETRQTIPILPKVGMTQSTPQTAWAETIRSRFGPGCHFLNLESWTHPTRPVIEKAGAEIVFVAMCRDDTYPVFGARFPYDPRAATEDYFHPLYAQTFLANGRWDYSFVEVDDGVLMSLSARGDGLALDIDELPLPGPVSDLPAGTASAQPEVAQPSASQAVRILFDGASLTGLEMLSYYGGDVDAHAHLDSDGLAVSIPERMGWALVGLRTQEPVIAPPSRDASKAVVLRAEVDPAVSDTLFLAFADLEQIGEEPWNHFDLRLRAFRDADGIGRYRLDFAGGSAVTTAAPWPENGLFSVVLRPDGVLVLRNGAGTALLRADIPVAMQRKTWFLRAYARPVGKNSPATLALRRLALENVTPQADPETDRPAETPMDTVLFDGRNIAPLWQPYEGYKGYFSRHAAVDGGLVIDRAADTDDVRLGLASVESALWLDRFTGNAEAVVRFELDGKDATGFNMTLAERVGLDEGGRVAFRLWFERDTASGTVRLRMLSPQADAPVELLGLKDIPDSFVLRLTPGWIRAEIDGTMPIDLPFASARDGAGLRIMVLAHALPKSDETRLTLHRITAKRIPGGAPRPRILREGVEPLPLKTLFDGQPGEDWLRQAQGALVFDDLVQVRPEGFRLFRQTDPKNGNRVALVSAAPVVMTDRRIKRTSFGVQMQLDPKDPDLAARFVLMSGTNPDKGADHEVTLSVQQDGAYAGQLKLALWTGHFYYDHWQRVLPRGWQETWDGTLSIALSDGIITVSLGARGDTAVTLSAQSAPATAGKELHLAILPGTRGTYEPGSVTLRKIEAGWLTPDGMDAVTRQELLDVADFSPEAWLAGLRILIDEETRR